MTLSSTAQNLYMVEYDSQIIAAHQLTQSPFRGMGVMKEATGASSVTLERGGTLTSYTKARGGQIVSGDIAYSTVSVTPVPYYARQDIEHTDEWRTKASQRQHTAKSAVWSLERRFSTVCTTALNSGATDFADTDGAFTRARVLALRQQLMENDVLLGNIACFIPPQSLTDILGSSSEFVPFASSDYTGNRPMDNASMKFSWLGINFVVFNDLPAQDATYKWAFMYDVGSFGYAVSSDITSKEEIIPGADSTAVWSRIDIGASVIDPRAVYKMAVTA